MYINGSSYANFGPGIVNKGIATAGGNNLFNSNGNYYENWLAVRPVTSIHCGCVVIDYTRDNIEINCCPLVITIKQK